MFVSIWHWPFNFNNISGFVTQKAMDQECGGLLEWNLNEFKNQKSNFQNLKSKFYLSVYEIIPIFFAFFEITCYLFFSFRVIYVFPFSPCCIFFAPWTVICSHLVPPSCLYLSTPPHSHLCCYITLRLFHLCCVHIPKSIHSFYLP